MAKKPKQTSRQPGLDRKKGRRLTASQLFFDQLEEVDELIELDRSSEAIALLNQLDAERPGDEEVLWRLADVYFRTLDVPALRGTCRRLVELNGPDPELTLMLASSYLSSECVASALTTFQQFLDRWPRDPRAEGVQETAIKLQQHVSRVVARFGFDGDDAVRLAMMHEEMQHDLALGKYRRVRIGAKRILERQPRFTPALNNMSMAAFYAGDVDEAIAACRRVLEIQSENCHALSNLIRYLYLRGDREEAGWWAEKLKSLETDQQSQWVKTAEALAVLGDDRGILDTFARFQRTGSSVEPSTQALLYHYAAFASLRLGDEAQARRWWAEAERCGPVPDEVRENLQDLAKPPGDRNGAWPLNFNHYLPKSLIDELRSFCNWDEDAGAREQACAFLTEHPILGGVISILLRRGDPEGCKLACRLAIFLKTPELLEELKLFVRGQHGTDELRSHATQFLFKQGLLGRDPIRMWIRGQCQDVILHTWEIRNRPEEDVEHSAEVRTLKDRAMEAWHAGDVRTAESLYLRALESEPGSPDLLNNLAATWHAQGCHQTALDLVRKIHEAHPDYVFASINLARFLLRQGAEEEAAELLNKQMQRKQYSGAEFNALCAAYLDFCWQTGDMENAASLLKTWEETNIQTPELEYWKQRLAGIPTET